MYTRLMTIIILSTTLLLNNCISPHISIFPGKSSSLKEYILEGTGEKKVLVISICGTISNASAKGLIKKKSNMVKTIVSHLKKAEKDENIKAVLLTITSSGGTVTASDLLYHEISEFKKRTGTKIIVSMLNVAASGAYYIALPADLIMAHPTTITGSIGVIYIRPVINDLMEKLGINININKTGSQKDMGSLFRPGTQEEEKIIQDIVDKLGQRFFNLIKKHRNIDPENMKKITTARVWLANEAKKLGLIDQIGYLKDAINAAKSIAKIPDNSKVITYRRSKYPNDNIYNTSSTNYPSTFPLLNKDNNLISESLNIMPAGFYYLWPSGDFQ